MTISIYQAAIPVSIHVLNNLIAILEKVLCMQKLKR